MLHEHGQQFKADELKTTHPASAEGIEKFLASGAVRSIGPKLAAKIVSDQGRILGAKVFRASVAVKALNAASAAAALDQAFGQCATELVIWAAGTM